MGVREGGFWRLRDDPERIFDELLVLRCRRGDVTAWKELVARYEKRLHYFIRRLVGSERDAWDLLQQTWLAAMKGIHRLDEPRTLRTWLYRIARNTAISHLRRSGNDPASVDPSDLRHVSDDQDDSHEDADTFFGADAAERVHEALAELSVPHREVLTLHFLEDASVEEIAAVTGVPPGTVKSRLYYAKRALRSVIEQRRELA
jgi:RNA polymerase sigma-70 factor (ECF subfamily)